MTITSLKMDHFHPDFAQTLINNQALINDGNKQYAVRKGIINCTPYSRGGGVRGSTYPLF
jgi:hypothetical protein